MSNDEYRIIDGVSVLWNGYNYEHQYWVFEGKEDTRTLEELQELLKSKKKDESL